MNDAADDDFSFESLGIYHRGYSMICEVATNYDPIGIVEREWALREHENEWMRQAMTHMPGLVYRAPTPEVLAIELLAAMGDLLESAPAFRPLLMRHLRDRSAGYERLYDQAMNADDDEDDHGHQGP